MPTAVNPPRTLYDKIWDDHVVCVYLVLNTNLAAYLFLSTQKADGLALIYIDRCAILIRFAVDISLI